MRFETVFTYFVYNQEGKMDKMIFFPFLICLSMMVHSHAQTLEASATLVKASNSRSIKKDPINAKLLREFLWVERWYKSGIPYDDALKRSSTLRKVLTDVVDRNKKDPQRINPDGTAKAMVISTYAQALCALAQQMNNQYYINLYCYNQQG